MIFWDRSQLKEFLAGNGKLVAPMDRQEGRLMSVMMSLCSLPFRVCLRKVQSLSKYAIMS